MRASISPITAHAPKSRDSTSRCNATSMPAAGKSNVFPQEITRVLLNLISNGFYAATRRAAEAGEWIRADTEGRDEKSR